MSLAAQDNPAIVLVLDDLGNNRAQGEAALALQAPITYAVLPHLAHSKLLAEQAHMMGKDVILHAPMANLAHKRLGPGALTPAQTKTEFQQVLAGNLADVPYKVGLNNHMGSLLTQQPEQMGWVMELARQQQLFFLDSRTSAQTQAWRMAKNAGVPWLMRDVFLDHEQTVEFVDQQFTRAVKLAKRYGTVVVIGHPYPVTVDYLQAAIPAARSEGVEFISARNLLFKPELAQRLLNYQHRQERRAAALVAQPAR